MSPDRGRLLVVDDNPDNLDMLSRRLRRCGFEVAVADHGRLALEHAAREAFDLVVLDIMMPDIDGLQVLEQLRRTHSVADLPVIMATAKDASDDVVKALELGANDYVTKPLDFPVLLARVRTQLALRNATRALESANQRMKRDLDAGAKVQRALIPSAAPAIPGIECAWLYEPCSELGGDTLDLFALEDGKLGLYLLDVSGHGVPAALLSVTLSRVLSPRGAGLMLHDGNGVAESAGTAAPVRNGHAPALPPAIVAGRLNQRFPMDPATRQYFTILYAILDVAGRELRYVAAGHPGPIHLRAGHPATSFDSTGLAIGWLPDTPFAEQTLPTAPGDRFYFYSDGVVEAQSAADEFFELERFLALLERTREEPLQASLEALRAELAAWCGAAGPRDDVSVLAIEVRE